MPHLSIAGGSASRVGVSGRLARSPDAEPDCAELVSLMTCSVFVGTSVDGFIARRDGSLDWLPPGGGEEHGYTAFLATVDAIVMGRGTFDIVAKFDRWPFQKPVIV